MAKSAAQPKYLVQARGPEVGRSPSELLRNRAQKYLLVNVLARRARELNKGARALVDLPPPHTPVEIALAEAMADKLAIERRVKSKVLVNLVKND